MKKQFLLFTICGLIASHNSYAGSSPDEHAPIGVMGDHSHKQGEIMASYRYGLMQMKGNRSGTEGVSTADVLADFMVAPTKMTMQMHMFGLMYGVSDKLTVMAMLPYKFISMDHVNRAGVKFSTKTEGIGDTKLTGLYTLYERNNQKLLFNAGISLPTGSIDERDNTPAGSDQKLPYPMQLGSGTYDMLPGITYTDKNGLWSWGSQLNAVVRLGENDNNYTLGNQYSLSAWGGRKLNEYASASLRLNGKISENIDGADADFNPNMVPTARTDLRGSKTVDLIIGVNLIAPHGKLKGHRLGIEAGLPVYQKFDGPQLETDYHLTVGWQLAF